MTLTRVWYVFAIASYFCVPGCETSDGVHVNTFAMTDLFNLERSLQDFRHRNGQTPNAGTLVSCTKFLKQTATGRRLQSQIQARGLDLDNLDVDELVMLFATASFDMVHHRSGAVFEPNPHYLTDIDSDGFFEYRLPGVGPVQLRHDVFKVLIPEQDQEMNKWETDKVSVGDR
ncbi:hypothetical protein [Allorhodopirellula solitaria]|nr:hypothetical protein [Allorhodopirellula solitaria]